MKIKFLITFCFLASLTNLYGQIVADSIVYSFELVNNRNVEALRTDINTTFSDITESRSWKKYDSTYITNSTTAIWLKFESENKSKDTVQNYIYSEENYLTTYKQRGQDLKIYKNGNLFLPSERTNKNEYNFTRIQLEPYQKSSFYLRLSSNKRLSVPKYVTLFSEQGYWELSDSISKKESNAIGFIYFYIIAIFTLFTFAFVFNLRLKRKLYYFYLGYLFFQLVYGFQVLRATTATLGNFFAYIPKLSNAFFQPAQFMFIGFYILFIIHLLKVEKFDKLLAKVLHYLGIFCLVYALSHFVFNYFFHGMRYSETIFVAIRLIILPLNFLLIFWIIYKVKHPLIPYFIIGQSAFFIGALLASYVGYAELYSIQGHFFNFTQSPNIIFQIGLLVEVFCFSLALGKNILLLQEEKDNTTAKLIDQLQQNKQLQEGMNIELDKKVNEKTTELIQLYSEIERVKEQKIKNEFTQKIRETEMVALRSQMNPHFIFNSLSAIKNLMMNYRNDDALRYLDDFSSLIRGILQNSNRPVITVEEELEILELYLSLEQSRMGEDFSYTIQVSSKEELSQYQIPPLLLQPLVENAIWHGLHPSLRAKKKLSIIFNTTESLRIIIEDNGIGRKESARKERLHKSMGTNIVQDRLTLYNHLNDHAIHLKISDLEEDNRPLGTKITLTYEY